MNPACTNFSPTAPPDGPEDDRCSVCFCTEEEHRQARVSRQARTNAQEREAMIDIVVCGECGVISPNHHPACSANSPEPFAAARELMGAKASAEERRRDRSSRFEPDRKPYVAPTVQELTPEEGQRRLDDSPYAKARAVFSKYAAMDAPELPDDNDIDRYGINLSALQVRLHRWHADNFGASTRRGPALGVSEEVGELAEAFLGLVAASGRISHAVLKNGDGIRGMEDDEKFRAAAADAIADAAIFSIQLCTSLRLDYVTLLKETAEKVLQRKWKKGKY